MPWGEWEVWCVCVCPILTHSPHIYSKEPWVRSCQSSVNWPCELMIRCHVEGLRRWGPWAGRPTSMVGRPASGSHHPNCRGWAVLGLPLSEHRCMDYPKWICFSSWATLSRIEPEFALWYFCDFLSSQSVLAACMLAKKHILHFSKGEVWFRGLFE